MIAFVDGLGDVGRTNAVTNFADEWSAETECINIGTIGTLADGTDDGLARDENLIAILIAADDAFWSDMETCVLSVSSGKLCHFAHQDRTIADVAVRSQGVAHLDEVHLLAVLTQVYSTLATCEAATEDYYFVADLIFLNVVIVDNDYIVTIDTRKWWNEWR